MNQLTNDVKGLSSFYQSYSGTDTLAFIILPNSSPIVLGSVTTVSYSMYRNKKPVINIGRTRINGVTRGSRIFAGTLVFTLINQHWLEEVKKKVDYIADFDDLKADELPLFDIMIVSANEYGNSVTMYIYGIDFTDEAQTISVQDLFTENVFSFVARDVSTFKAGEILSKQSRKGSNLAYVNLSKGVRNYNFDETDLSDKQELERLYELNNSADLYAKEQERKYILTRRLYYSGSKMLIGTDVSKVQSLLKRYAPSLNINGIYDQDTENAVRLFQSKNGLDITGIVTQRDYDFLMNQVEDKETKPSGIVINRSGARVFRYPQINSDIVDFIPFKTIVEIEDSINNNNYKFYKINTGYILEQDLYNYFNDNLIYGYPTLKQSDSNQYVIIAQNLLAQIYPDMVIPSSGIFDNFLKNIILRFQEENGLIKTGDINEETWFSLLSATGNKVEDKKDEVKVTYPVPPGKYTMSLSEMINSKMFDVVVSSEKDFATKSSAIIYYSNGKSKIKARTNIIKDSSTIKLNDFQPYLYLENYGTPKTIDFFITLYNQKTYKWTIDVVE